MALMVCWMSVVHGFRVYGETYDISDGESNIKTSGTNGSTKNTSNGIARATSGNLSYTYTGEMYVDGSVSLYDYQTDREIIGESINSTASGYTDPYTIFNTKISQSGSSEYPASDNITITYTPDSVFPDTLERIWVKLWNSSDESVMTTYDAGILMELNTTTNKFECTVNPGMLGFTPDRLVFFDKKGHVSDTVVQTSLTTNKTYNYKKVVDNMVINCVQTTDRGASIQGRCYHNTSGQQSGGYQTLNKYKTVSVNSSTNKYYYGSITVTFVPNYISFQQGGWEAKNKPILSAIELGYTYVFNGGGEVQESYHHVALDSTGNSAQALNGSAYDTPLYFGCFWKDLSGRNYKPHYDNFYWQPNLAQQLIGTSSASVQGMIDSGLTSGVPAQSGTPLPYFTKDALGGLVKGYEGLQFPFYKISIPASQIKGNDLNSSHNTYFYQFNAKENTAHLTGNDTTGYSIEETDQHIQSQIAASNNQRTIGFFPFNNENCTTDDAPTNNLGFGAVFTVDFYLNKDGLVDTYDSDDNTTGSKVRTMFEFVGDDDVWVFSFEVRIVRRYNRRKR